MTKQAKTLESEQITVYPASKTKKLISNKALTNEDNYVILTPSSKTSNSVPLVKGQMKANASYKVQMKTGASNKNYMKNSFGIPF